MKRIIDNPELLFKASVFHSVILEGTFRSAAKAMGLAPSTVSQHVSDLEDVLAVRLLERTTRRLSLTDEGQLFFENLDRAFDSWTDAWDSVHASIQEPRGKLVVSAPGFLGAKFLAPVAAHYISMYPKVELDLRLSDRLGDLDRTGIDVALWGSPGTDTSMTARKLATDYDVVVASPSLLPKRRALQLADLESLPWCDHTERQLAKETVLKRGKGQKHSFRQRCIATSSTIEGLLALVESGVGAALIATSYVKDAIADGRLIHLFPGWYLRKLNIYAIYRSRRLLPARTTRFIDLLFAELGPMVTGSYTGVGGGRRVP